MNIIQISEILSLQLRSLGTDDYEKRTFNLKKYIEELK
jgi:hypothetical protein